MTKEKRPQDWNLEERLQLVIACGSLDDEAINTLCREQGVYPHHVKQWKADLVLIGHPLNIPRKNLYFCSFRWM